LSVPWGPVVTPLLGEAPAVLLLPPEMLPPMVLVAKVVCAPGPSVGLESASAVTARGATEVLVATMRVVLPAALTEVLVEIRSDVLVPEDAASKEAMDGVPTTSVVVSVPDAPEVASGEAESWDKATAVWEADAAAAAADDVRAPAAFLDDLATETVEEVAAATGGATVDEVESTKEADDKVNEVDVATSTRGVDEIDVKDFR
jgi:hypothetical protein